jgi:Ni,Fe-hydrogenase I small subunit
VVDLLVGDAVGFVTASTTRSGWAPFPTGYISLDYQSELMAGAGNPTGSNGDANGYLKCLRAAGGYVVAVSGSIPLKDLTAQLAYNREPRYCVVGEHSLPGMEASSFFDYGKYGSAYDDTAVTGRSIVEVLPWLAENAAAVVSFGTCASYGGIPAGQRNRTQSGSVYNLLVDELGMSKPIINVPGCAPHPDWMVYPVAWVYLYLHGLRPTLAPPLDTNYKAGHYLNRPRAIYTGDIKGYTVMCDGCPRRTFRDTGKRCSDVGAGPGNGDGTNQKEWCLIDVGCNGPYASPDCPTRKWNNFDPDWVAQSAAFSTQHNSFCVDANHPCQGCCEPDFPDGRSPFYMPKTS